MRLTPDQNRLVESLFDRVCDLAMPEALSILDNDCDDPAVRDAVQRLLEAEQATQRDPGDQLRRDLAGALDQGVPDTTPPEQIGPYRIIETLGEGGMGVVYLAEQSKPVKRRVALKIIKLGMDSEAVVTRFEAERQALAMMDHPNVASVFGGGKTEQGRPYFVMEYVDGVSITRYCDEHQLTIKERLDLFMKVCDAVQHAHQKGIIHRDIKPANVLVSEHEGKAVPRVIDFGVAKALHEKLTEKTLMSRQGQLIGTLEYMSPEQAEMTREDIDTRSDIYSLGVLLYELLTGVLPFDSRTLREASLLEIRRIICEEEPSKPSLRLINSGEASEETAQCRSTGIRTLGKDLRGDLDWIVMKCLEKNRARRYDTARGVAEDIQRHLSYEPVLAGPPSAAYRMSRFMQRNRGGVIAAGLILSVLVLGIVGTSIGMKNASERARELNLVAGFQSQQFDGLDLSHMARATRELILDKARAAMEWRKMNQEEIDRDMAELDVFLAGIDFVDVSRITLFEQMIGPSVDAAKEQFSNQPTIRAQLLQAAADNMRIIGRYEDALQLQEEVLAVRVSTFGDGHEDTMSSMRSLGRLFIALGRHEEAEAMLRTVLPRFRELNGDLHPETLSTISELGIAIEAQGRLEDAEPYYKEALAGRLQELGPSNGATVISVNNFGYLKLSQGLPDDAEEIFRDAVGRLEPGSGGYDDPALHLINNLGWLLKTQGNLDEAEQYLQLAVDGYQRLYGRDHEEFLTSSNNYALLREAQGRFLEAIEIHELVLAGRREVLGSFHDHTLGSLNNIGWSYFVKGEYEQAEPFLREALSGRRRVLGARHPRTMTSVFNLGVLLESLGNHEQSLVLMDEAIEKYESAGHNRAAFLNAVIAIAAVNGGGDYVESQRRLREGPAHGRELFNGDHWLRSFESLLRIEAEIGRQSTVSDSVRMQFQSLNGFADAPSYLKFSIKRTFDRIEALSDQIGDSDFVGDVQDKRASLDNS